MSATRSRGAGLALAIAALASCGDAPPAGPVVAAAPEWTVARRSEARELEARLAALAPGSRGQLRVHLAFGPEADLDLYVTDPLEETVYYANTPSRIGGELLEDRRCEHAGPRIESARLPLAPGRYRVGVDYPHACGETRAPVPFALLVETPAGRQQIRGLAAHQVFEPVVFEFELDPEVKP